MKRRGAFRWIVAVVLVVSVVAGLAAWNRWGGSPPAADIVEDQVLSRFRPIEVAADGYVGADVCRDCHPRNHASWHASYHRTMTTLPSAETVHGDFSQGPFEFAGRRYELQQRGDQFWAVMNDPDARLVPGNQDATRIERPIALVTGSHHLQLYWYPIGQTRVLGLLPIHYFKEEGKWLPTSATMLRPSGGHFESDTGRWNVRCLQCHATHGRSRPVRDGLDTEVAEFGISCEACHGPGEEHVQARRATPTGGPPSKDTIVNPRRLSSKDSAQICGLCHSYTRALTPENERHEMKYGFFYRPGDQLADSLLIERQNEATRKHLHEAGIDPDRHFAERFWPDGMVRVAGREYNGLLESACHQRGEMSCVSCHAMHQSADDPRSPAEWASRQVKPGMDSDQACVQCHDSAGYASVEHTHHAAESTGSRCYNCHMPHTTFGILRAMRSHQIESPRVATSLKYDRPNGCNLCHLDKSLDWSAGHLEQWYGQRRPTMTDDQRDLSAAVLWTLSGDAGQRAIAAWNMGWAPAQAASGNDWMVPFLVQLLEDDYEAVRMLGYRSLRQIPGYEDIEYDFVASRAARTKVAEEVRARWKGASRASAAARAEVLLDDQGQLLRDEFERLLRQRNRRSVILLE